MFFKNRLRGAGLVEAIIGIGIFGVVVMSTTKYFGNNIKATKRSQYRNARDQLAYMIAESLNNPENLALSAVKGQFNAQLRNCIKNNKASGNGTCKAIGINNAKSFSLHVISDNESGDVLVGKENRDDTHYDWGALKPNTSSPSEDTLHPSVYFWGDCGIDPDTKDINDSCNKAANIYLSFVIRPSLGPYSANYVGSNRNPDKIYPYPKDAVNINGDVELDQLFKNAVVVSSFEISSRMDSMCPMGEYLSGYESDGTEKCECFQKDCKNNKCKDDEILVGWKKVNSKEEYKEPVCRSLTNENDFQCITLPSGASSCPSGYWFSKINLTVRNKSDGNMVSCTGHAEFRKPSKKKWRAIQAWSFDCDGRKFQCCTLKGLVKI